MKRELKLNVFLREQLFPVLKLCFSAVLAFTFERDLTYSESWMSDSCRQCLKRLIIL